MRHPSTLLLLMAALVGCHQDEELEGFPQPDTTLPDATQPDAVQRDAAQRDATQPDATLHDATLPDATLPDATLPDATQPDAAQPDATLPDATQPDDCDGTPTDQPCATDQPGVCAAGLTACIDDAITCLPLTAPGAETCDAIDNNCDGRTDEDISRSCYRGPDGTVGVGICRSGTQLCAAGVFGACNGEVLPADEICDALDNDCNGIFDEFEPTFDWAIFPSELGCWDLAIGDLNGDGRPDVACAPVLTAAVDPDTRIPYWLNTGGGGFGPVRYTAPVVVSPFRAQSDIALADLDRDGDLDLVAVGLTMKAQVYRNDNGALAAPVDAFDFATGDDEPGTAGLVLTDLTGDGRVDIATHIGSARNPDWRLAVANGNGDGTFAAPREFGVSMGAPVDLLARDIDADGDVDLIAWAPPAILLYRADAGGYEAPVVIFEASGDGYELAYAELTGDAHFDLVVPGASEWFFARGQPGGFAAPVRVDDDRTLSVAATGEFDCDPGRELLLIGPDPLLPLTFVTEPATQSGDYGWLLAHLASDVEVADLDADGLDDVVIGDPIRGFGVLIQRH